MGQIAGEAGLLKQPDQPTGIETSMHPARGEPGGLLVRHRVDDGGIRACPELAVGAALAGWRCSGFSVSDTAQKQL